MLKSKIHRATVTHAELHYEGSLSIDRELMDRADIVPYEEVHVWNVSNGSRITTYAIEAPAGSGIVCVNGAAAHLVHVGHLVIIATFCDMEKVDRRYQPTVVMVDRDNRAIATRPEIAGPKLAS
jgi:aspartate 1-decarboxylase